MEAAHDRLHRPPSPAAAARSLLHRLHGDLGDDLRRSRRSGRGDRRRERDTRADRRGDARSSASTVRCWCSTPIGSAAPSRRSRPVDAQPRAGAQADRRSGCRRPCSSALVATLFGLLLGIPVAVASALRPGSLARSSLSGWSALALGVPTFWLGILRHPAVRGELRWLPSASGYVPFWQNPAEMLRNTLLPAMTLGVYVSGIFARFLRASLVAELKSDYVRTARSKGLHERDVIGRHVMRNALLPFVTVVGLMLANFVGGTVVTEAVFTYPGLGRLLDRRHRHTRLPADPGLHPGHPDRSTFSSTSSSMCSTPISTRASTTHKAPHGGHVARNRAVRPHGPRRARDRSDARPWRGVRPIARGGGRARHRQRA